MGIYATIIITSGLSQKGVKSCYDIELTPCQIQEDNEGVKDDCLSTTVKPVYKDHPRETRNYSLQAVDLYVQVSVVHVSMRNNFQGKQKMWSVQTGGLSIQVVTKEGLTKHKISTA